MANKVITINSSKSAVKQDAASAKKYVYMDIDMIAGYKKIGEGIKGDNGGVVCLATEKNAYEDQQYVVDEEDLMHFWLYCQSNVQLSKRVYNYISTLQRKSLDDVNARTSSVTVRGQTILLYQE